MSAEQQQLYDAASEGRLDVVQQLLDSGVNPNIVFDRKWWSPIYIATLRGHPAVVKALLKGGAYPNTWTSQGVTALHEAVLTDNIEIVNILLKAGAKTESKEFILGETPLFTACKNGRTEIVKALVDAGANVNNDVKGYLPIDMAAMYRNIEIVKILLAAGADVNKKGFEGKSIIERAREGHFYPEINEILYEAAAESLVTEPLPPEITKNNVITRVRRGNSNNSIRNFLATGHNTAAASASAGSANSAATAGSAGASTARRNRKSRKARKARKSRRSSR